METKSIGHIIVTSHIVIHSSLINIGRYIVEPKVKEIIQYDTKNKS